MHIDLWIPDRITDKNGRAFQLMNTMCDLTQFLISRIVDEASSKNLETLFLEQIVLLFGMVAVVVFDADSIFLHF